MKRFRIRSGLIALIGILLVVSAAKARPAHKRALADYFGSLLASKLNDCRTCHLPDKPGAVTEDGEKPHNAFGKRMAEVRKQLKKAGKGTDIPTRLEAIASEDSDGDGVPNLIELLSGHFPGDAMDRPSAEEIAMARQTLVAFRSRKAEYSWKPFEAVRRPQPPRVRRQAWVRNAIDAFVAAGHEKQGLAPRPEASRPVLLRRLYLDLIGIPPTPEQVAAFVHDPAQDAYEKVVDHLLASPQYGERWARHWMDIWRYSDWYGYGAEVRNSQPHIWHWRDWIVEALNTDKGYDRMIVEMLAGDELAPDDARVIRATGFLVRNWYKFNRHVWLDDIIEHTAKAFLGVTLNCARCHDHFYDPITQREYYQFRAFFEPHQIRTDRLPHQVDTAKDGLVRVYDAELNPQTFLFIRGDDRKPDKKRPLTPDVLSALAWEKVSIQPIKLPRNAVYPDKRAFVIEDLLAERQSEIDRQKAARDGAAKRVLASLFRDLAGGAAPLSMISSSLAGEWEALERAEVEFALARARDEALRAVLCAEALEDAGNKGPEWEKAARQAVVAERRVDLQTARKNVLAARAGLRQAKALTQAAARAKLKAAEKALAGADEVCRKPATTHYARRKLPSYPASSTGRRLALARWIADRRNPLTARVAMNHIWLRHFGKPLVPTVFDFGRNGRPPTHPALLDWLADEFMRQNWSMKAMHRLLVTSNAYRMSSSADQANEAIDPDNRWLWRMNVRRMEAEAIRDSVLAVAGKLDPAMGGPELDQHLGQTTYRRSLYYRYAQERAMEFVTLFDAGNVNECYMRTESIVPQQALALANSGLVLSQARLLARKLAAEQGPARAAFVRAGFEHVLGRPPSPQEQALCVQFLKEQTAMLGNAGRLTPFAGASSASVAPSTDPKMRARENLINVLFNHNDFVTIR
jgi:hypothetical protein